MPESLYRWKSAAVKVCGCVIQCSNFEGLSTNGDSISSVVVRPTSSTAREEYSAGEPGATAYRPRRITGAAGILAGTGSVAAASRGTAAPTAIAAGPTGGFLRHQRRVHIYPPRVLTHYL